MEGATCSRKIEDLAGTHRGANQTQRTHIKFAFLASFVFLSSSFSFSELEASSNFQHRYRFLRILFPLLPIAIPAYSLGSPHCYSRIWNRLPVPHIYRQHVFLYCHHDHSQNPSGTHLLLRPIDRNSPPNRHRQHLTKHKTSYWSSKLYPTRQSASVNSSPWSSPAIEEISCKGGRHCKAYKVREQFLVVKRWDRRDQLQGRTPLEGLQGTQNPHCWW